MSDQRHSLTNNTGNVARQASDERPLSFNEMKSMLQNVEKRLLGQEPFPVDAVVGDAPTHDTLISTLPKLDNTVTTEPYVTFNSKVARVNWAKSDNRTERRFISQGPLVAAERQTHNLGPEGNELNAGPDWFHLPRTKLTSDLKRELQLLKMRSSWDPKRHYKGDNRRSLIPEYAQIGTIMEGPAEYYSSRITKRDRKSSFLEEVLAAEKSSGRFKRTYTNIQSSKASGRRAFYDNLKGKRSKR